MYNFSNFNDIEKHELTLDKFKDELQMLIRQSKAGTQEWNELVIKIDKLQKDYKRTMNEP